MDTLRIVLAFFALIMLIWAIVRSIRVEKRCQQAEKSLTFEDIIEKRAVKCGMTSQEYLDKIVVPEWLKIDQEQERE